MIKLAVYGTLKKGFHNHKYLDVIDYENNFLGCDLLPGFYMVDAGRYPAAYYNGNKDQSIFVEIYNISEQAFKACDYLEGYPMLYDRITTSTKFGEAFIYVSDRLKNNSTIIPNGFWKL